MQVSTACREIKKQYSNLAILLTICLHNFCFVKKKVSSRTSLLQFVNNYLYNFVKSEKKMFFYNYIIRIYIFRLYHVDMINYCKILVFSNWVLCIHIQNISQRTHHTEYRSGMKEQCLKHYKLISIFIMQCNYQCECI